MTILERIVARKREEVLERSRVFPLSSLRAALPAERRDFAAALAAPGLSAICEIKRRSPSRGPLCESLDPVELAGNYARSGAAALSVLTDRDFFGGSEDDLRQAREATALPVLRKDFTIEPYQVFEARAIGADAILLIAAILTDTVLSDLRRLAAELGLAALVEVHDEAELDRAIAAGATLIGVNNRDLRTFKVSLETCLRLRARIPSGVLSVAESGIATRADVRRLEDAGFDAALIGEALVTDPRPGARLESLLGRDA